MRTGKLSEPVLGRSVLRQLHSKNDCVIAGAEYGTDFAAIQQGEGEVQVYSINPVTLSGVHAGMFAVCNVLNDIASSGAVPAGVLCSILLPTSSNETELRAIVKEMDEACTAAGAQLLGGHTEVSRAVKAPLLTATGIGTAKKERLLKPQNVRPGMDLVVTKWIGLEGTVILAEEHEEELRTRYAQPFLDKAKAHLSRLSVIPEAAVAVRSGVAAMHNASQGGIFAALWEFAEAAGIGLEVDLKKIPIRQETVEICEFFDINPYKLLSQGAMLMAAEDGTALVRALTEAEIPAVIIGKATDGNDRILLCDGERRFLETAQVDELVRLNA